MAHVDPRYPRLQVQKFGLVHLPWIQRLLQIAKKYNDIYHHQKSAVEKSFHN